MFAQASDCCVHKVRSSFQDSHQVRWSIERISSNGNYHTGESQHVQFSVYASIGLKKPLACNKFECMVVPSIRGRPSSTSTSMYRYAFVDCTRPTGGRVRSHNLHKKILLSRYRRISALAVPIRSPACMRSIISADNNNNTLAAVSQYYIGPKPIKR